MSTADRDELAPTERDLVGQWLDTGTRIEQDAVAARIEWLIAERLERVTDSSTGWEVLYRDPRDGRFWELTHPHSRLHSGGPPRLTVLCATEAASKYGLGTG